MLACEIGAQMNPPESQSEKRSHTPSETRLPLEESREDAADGRDDREATHAVQAGDRVASDVGEAALSRLDSGQQQAHQLGPVQALLQDSCN